jgi:hypothetical protein
MLVRQVTIPALMAAGVFQMRRTTLRLPDTAQLLDMLRPHQGGLQDMKPQPRLLLHPHPAIHSRPELKRHPRQEAVNKQLW